MSVSRGAVRRCRVGLALLLAAATSGCSDDSSPEASSGGTSSSQAGAKADGAGNGSAEGGKSSGGSGQTGGGGKTGGGGTVSGVSGSAGKSSGTGGTTPVGGGKSTAAEIARKLGREPNFLIGLGNDLPGDYVWEKASAYHLGAKLDLHYVYLAYGWQDWNPGGYFAQVIAEIDVEKGITPMSTVYCMAGAGEGNFEVLSDDEYMTPYWEGAKLLIQRYAELDVPALVHLEPDFWAYGQRQSDGDPSKIPARLSPDCAGLPQNLSGVARCWVKLARDLGPKVLVGLHASEWGGEDGNDVGKFLNALGAAETDLVIIDILDRDAGCFEAGNNDVCTRDGQFYLDETNETSPNYAERLSFAKQVSTTTGKPILWWQLPLGVPSNTPGGTPGHYRDNKVRYLFSHVQEFVDAGGVGATFGVGAEAQTTVGTDGGQFDDAVTSYYAAPVPLP